MATEKRTEKLVIQKSDVKALADYYNAREELRVLDNEIEDKERQLKSFSQSWSGVICAEQYDAMMAILDAMRKKSRILDQKADQMLECVSARNIELEGYW